MRGKIADEAIKLRDECMNKAQQQSAASVEHEWWLQCFFPLQQCLRYLLDICARERMLHTTDSGVEGCSCSYLMSIQI